MRKTRSARRIFQVIATLFGTGYFPLAPGTAGTIVALVLYLLLPGSFFINLFPGFTVIIFLTFAGVFLTGCAEIEMSRDDKRIVLDEFCGFFFAVFFLPKNLVLVIIAFILFRTLDIFKPFPVNIIQKLRNGWGIMADDVLAGILTNICLQILIRIFPEII